jgi:hypothetical protein
MPRAINWRVVVKKRRFSDFLQKSLNALPTLGSKIKKSIVWGTMLLGYGIWGFGIYEGH